MKGVAQGEVDGPALGRRRDRDPEAVPAVPDRVPVAVPVGHDDRKTGGHGLHRRDAEGLLDVVGHRDEDVGGAPGPAIGGAVAPLRVEEAHRRGEAGLGVPVGLGDGLVVELAGLDADQPAAGGDALEGDVDRGGVGLGVEGQAAGEEEDHLVACEAQGLPRRGDLGGRALMRGDVHPQGDDRQLDLGEPGGAIVLRQPGATLRHQAPDQGLRRRRGADEGVPGLEGRARQVPDAVHGAERGQGVGDPEQAVGGRTLAVAVVRHGGGDRPRVIDGARKARGRRDGALLPPDQASGEPLAGQVVHHQPGGAAAKAEDITVSPAAGQGAEQRLADGLAAHQLGVGGIAVAHIVDGEVHGPGHSALVRRRALSRKSAPCPRAGY